MRLTTKGRYGLAVIVLLSKSKGQTLPLQTIADSLGLSKLYLEQILAVLRSHQLVSSVKGPSGGYSVTPDSDLSVYDVLSVLEPILAPTEMIEKADKTLGIVLDEMVYGPLDQSVEKTLKKIRIDALCHRLSDESMYYI